ncbi:ribonucleoside triphosphate reductase, partial [Candidatus Bathyarchaeota archaeon]
PAKHFRTALGQVVNFFYTLQGEAAGAQAFSNFDTHLAPFIRYDGLSQKEVEQALQEFFFNMNVPTRVGFQTPFTNVTLDLKVPDFMKNEPVIIGGKLMDETYGDMQEEMEMFNEAFLKVMLEGDARGRVFTFPIPTYNVTKDFDWDSPVAQKLFEVTAKYGVPYFSNFVNSDMKPEDVRSMCCRLRIDNRELRKRGGGFFGANPLTGSIGVVTLNLPRIGYLSKDETEFFERLEALMETARDSLEIKRKVLERFTEKGLYPYSRHYLRLVKEGFGKYWKNHFSTIGLVGMNEAILNLFGYGIATPEGLKFAIKVLTFMREKLADFQEETGNIYNLEATPAEGTSYRLARIDKRKYPDIIVANEKYLSKGAEPFYTNSSQLPVDYEIDLFEALEHQDKLQTLYTGGTVFHIYLGERVYSWKATAELVKKVAWNFHLPYFTLTPTFSICPSHGYLSGGHKHCPKCGAKCEVYSRVVGYLRPVDQWNDGKQAEFAIRRTFDKSVVVRTVQA